MNNFETIIGVEVHAELNTKHKIFSPALNNVESTPNTNVHPIDLGLPGTLPIFNEEVLQKAILISKSLNMDISKNMHWDRKNYFYHDNPKGYQITQFDTPIGRNGYIELDNGKKINIDFMHMEEDTAKTFNRENLILLDYNRCGVPLVEIVTSPSLRSSSETKEYLEKLREILVFLNVSDGKLDMGSFRVDVNVSIRPYGVDKLYPKVEIKNLNSFANVTKAIEIEVKEQIKSFNLGQKILQTTKRYDEDNKKLVIMRIKEGVADYRYFPEPDLQEINLTEEYITKITSDIPKLPQVIRKELIEEYKINHKEVDILLNDKAMTDFFLETLNYDLVPQKTLNYLLSNVLEYLNKNKLAFIDSKITIENFVDINNLLNKGEISSNHVKKIIPLLLDETNKVLDLVEKLGLKQISDPKIILELVTEVLKENPGSIELFNSGKERAKGFLIGQIIKKSKGQANPVLVTEILDQELAKSLNEKNN